MKTFVNAVMILVVLFALAGCETCSTLCPSTPEWLTLSSPPNTLGEVETQLAPNRYLGIAPVSKVCPLPEVANDVHTLARFFAMLGYETQVVTATVVPVALAKEKVEWLNGSDMAVLHYSGHGLVQNKAYALWLGNASNVWEWQSVINDSIAPASQKCRQLAVVIDSCFGGSGFRATTPVPEKRNARIKTVGTDLNDAPAKDLLNADVKIAQLKNVLWLSACGKKQEADGAWPIWMNGGSETMGTYGMSLYSYCLMQQLCQAVWMEYVAENNWNYRQTKGDWRAARQVHDGVKNQQHKFYEGSGSAKWRGCPPRIVPPEAQIRIGREHDGNLF